MTAPDSKKPTAKVTVGSLAGAVAVVLVWVASLAGLDVPPEVAAALTLIIGGVAAYLMPER